jgi:hypothetical protein
MELIRDNLRHLRAYPEIEIHYQTGSSVSLNFMPQISLIYADVCIEITRDNLRHLPINNQANFLYTTLNYSWNMLKPHGFVVPTALLSLL